MSRKNEIVKVLSKEKLETRQSNLIFGRIILTTCGAFELMVLVPSVVMNFAIIFSPLILISQLALAAIAVPVFWGGRRTDKALAKIRTAEKEQEYKRSLILKSQLKEQYEVNLTDDQVLALIQGRAVENSFNNKTIRYEMVRNDQGIENLTVTESVKKNLALSNFPQELAAGKEKPNTAKETVLPVALFN